MAHSITRRGALVGVGALAGSLSGLLAAAAAYRGEARDIPGRAYPVEVVDVRAGIMV